MKYLGTVACVLVIATGASCKNEKKADPAAPKAGEPTAKESPGKAAAPSDDAAKVLAAKPTTTVAIEPLGVSIDVPEGTTVTPERRPEDAKRRANLKQGDFMVNVSAVDEFSTPDFAKAKEIYKSEKLVAWIRADETPTGWITFKEVISDLHKSNRFEVGVRTQLAGKKWDCSISAATRALAELSLTACQTLK